MIGVSMLPGAIFCIHRENRRNNDSQPVKMFFFKVFIDRFFFMIYIWKAAGQWKPAGESCNSG